MQSKTNVKCKFEKYSVNFRLVIAMNHSVFCIWYLAWILKNEPMNESIVELWIVNCELWRVKNYHFPVIFAVRMHKINKNHKYTRTNTFQSIWLFGMCNVQSKLYVYQSHLLKSKIYMHWISIIMGIWLFPSIWKYQNIPKVRCSNIINQIEKENNF